MIYKFQETFTSCPELVFVGGTSFFKVGSSCIISVLNGIY